jgi:hypothetical protein
MKKIIFYTVIFSLTINWCWGQSKSKDFQIELSDEKEIEKKGLIIESSDQLLGFVAEKDQYLHLIKLRPIKGEKHHVLQDEIFDRSLNLLEYNEISTVAEVKNLPLELEEFQSVSGRPILFYSQYEKDRSSKTLYVKYFGKEDADKKEKKLISFTTESKKKGEYDVIFSPDSTLFMVVVSPQNAKRDNYVNKAYVFDQDFNNMGSYDLEVEHPADKVKAVWFLNNAGQPTYVLSQPRKVAKKGFGSIEKSINIFKSENDVIKYNLDIKDLYIEDIKLAGESNSDLVFLGSITGNTKRSVNSPPLSCLGTVYISVDKRTFELKKKSTQYFSDDILQFMRIKPAKLQKGQGINYLNSKYAWLTESNNAVIILSVDYVSVFRDRYSERTEYVSGLKMAVKYNEEGKVVYQRIIPTNNRTKNDSDKKGLHWHAFKSGENVIFLYNTHEKNIANSSNIKSSNKINTLNINFLLGNNIKLTNVGNKGIVVVAELNETGKLRTQTIPKANLKNMWVAKTQVYSATDEFYAALASKSAFVVLKGKR